MAVLLEVSAEEMYEKAVRSLDEDDFVNFISNISNANLLAKENPDLLPKVTFLKVQGLFRFNQYTKALESIQEALDYNTGLEALRLRNYEGVIYGHLGKLHPALKIFKELVSETDNLDFKMELYLNITWVLLTLDKGNHNERTWDEVKRYLDLAQSQFDHVSDVIKRKICNNYSVYYFYIGEYQEAIQCLEKAITYCTEKDLPQIYNNLAEIYLEIDNEEELETIKEYANQAEVLGCKYNDTLSVAKAFYTKAMVELREDQFFTALDTLYLAFEYFKEAESYSYAFDCLVKVNEIINDYKVGRLRTLKDSLRDKLKGTPYFNQI